MINETLILRQLHDSKQREQAFTEIVREYQEPLYWQIRRIVLYHDDANDVLQNTFIKAWSAIDAFRGESKLITWLLRIAINEALNFLEKESNKIRISETENNVVSQLQSDPYFDGDELELKFQEVISKLPPKQQIVFNMKYFQELKYEEISQILGTSVGALKTSYHIAVQKIISFFEKLD
ncbi:MAG: RNA polymerase sigma factor [Bacteroidaceae bacterium]|nr:RNA polymerase sigma factor [Bacteroidaceae bacterium]